MVPDHLLESLIKSRLPAHLWQGWRMIARNMVSPQCERETDEVARWISRHGAEHGFRAPNTRERGRAMGMMAYLGELELEERVLYDAQGNLFDRHVVPLRVSRPVVRWLQGEEVPRHAYPAVADIEAGYQELRVLIEREGLPAQAEGVPRDVQAAARRRG